MTDKQQDSTKSGSVELKEEELDQVQGGATARDTSSSKVKATSPRDGTRVKHNIDLTIP